VKLSYRRRLYNPDKIIRALEQLELQPLTTAKAGRSK
jgi:hypothetical protein